MRPLTVRWQRRNQAWNRRQRWKRERQIVSALVRHGLGLTLVQTGMGWLLPFQRGLLSHPRRDEPYSGPEHLRMAFEDLGPTFIKLAQILSTRGDLIGAEYASELARLQSGVPPVPFPDMALVLDAELPVPRDEVFATFDTDPIGSGSIGQVYRATLHSGEAVVVKIQKPETRATVEMDLAILHRWIRRRTSRDSADTFYDVEGFFEEFAFTLRNELDYTNEGDNADRIRGIHRDDAAVFIPTIYWDYSTSRVLVMDEVRGTDFADVALDTRLTPDDRHRLAMVALHTAFTQIFREGFFHADPHPGNFIVTEDLRIGLIDFGMVGTLTERQREHFLDFAYSMASGDTEGILDALWALGVTEPEAHRSGVARDLDHLFYRVGDRSFEDLAAGDMVGELMRIAHRHQLQFPASLALLFKVLAMLESAAVLVDPDFLFFQALEPELAAFLKERTSPTTVLRRVGRDALDMVRLFEGLPHRVDRLLQRLETGDLELATRERGRELEAKGLHRAVNRLALAIAVTLFLVAAGVYVLAVEVAETGSSRLAYLRVLLAAGGVFLAVLGARIWWTRNR
ncbi:MAG: AarF/ABC1/UbiB kinase family protein [Acidobacteria bacterium]|nr:AarF/ABC1/UbiB kinase family protein [Acidobacteriota bacterium]